jgi:hypothetical protein
MFVAMRLASSLPSNFAADHRPGSLKIFGATFVVMDANGQQLAYVYFEE